MSQNTLTLILKCHVCEKAAYTSSQNLQRHLKTVHSLELRNVERTKGKRRPQVTGITEEEDALKENEEGAQFSCCGCFKYFESLVNLAEHIEEAHCLSLDLEDTVQTTNLLPEVEELSHISYQSEALKEDSKDSLPARFAVAKAFGIESESHLNLTTGILKAADLKPFHIKTESNSAIAFASPSQLKRILDVFEEGDSKNKKFKVDTYTDQPEAECRQSNLHPAALIEQIINTSQYSQILSLDKFNEITDEQIEILNTSWDGKPMMSITTSQLLAGCILVDSYKAILVGTVETYNRNPRIDAHFEAVKPETFHLSSIPRIGDSVYDDIKFVKRSEENTVKLIIGTQELDALIVSSIRIDNADVNAETGPSTHGLTPSSRTRMYLSRKSVETANKIIKTGKLPVSFHKLAALKQIRTKFHKRSTYSYCRSHSCFTDSIDCRPVTVFTYANSTEANTSSSLGSLLFQLVFECVEKNQKLNVNKVKNLVNLYPTARLSEVSRSISDIISLFKEEEEVEVLGNTTLDMYLRAIAKFITSSSLANANKNVAITIKKVFEKK